MKPRLDPEPAETAARAPGPGRPVTRGAVIVDDDHHLFAIFARQATPKISDPRVRFSNCTLRSD